MKPFFIALAQIAIMEVMVAVIVRTVVDLAVVAAVKMVSIVMAVDKVVTSRFFVQDLCVSFFIFFVFGLN